MPLSTRIPKLLPSNQTLHTIRHFRAAAIARLSEARHLALGEHRLASIYLMGYSAEMLLKAAYFRLCGWSLTQPITLGDIKQAQVYAKQHLQCSWPGNLHYLPGWKDLLATERSRRNLTYPKAFWRSLNAHVNRLALNWMEVMRYYDIRPFLGEIRSSEQAATWLVGQFRYL